MYGTLKVEMILNSTINLHHIRRVRLFSGFGSKAEAAEEVHKFLEANPDVARMNTELVWVPQVERVQLNDLAAMRKQK